MSDEIRGINTYQVWHDEANRLFETGRLDQGPCWCPDCISKELEDDETET